MSEQQKGGVYVRFYKRAVEDKTESEKQGRPVFKDKPYIEIIVAGDPKNIVDRPANPLDEAAYPGAWAAFKAGAEQQQGFPLKDWAACTRSQVEELAAFKVYTVEQLANTADVHLRGIGPFLALRQKARDWLEAAAKNAPIADLQAQVESLRKQLEATKTPQQPKGK
jgi:hypothetical protein